MLHNFRHRSPLFAACHRLLRAGGRLLLRDFNPVAAKLFGDGLRPDGGYFDASLHAAPMAYHDLLPADARAHLRPVVLRRWTVGEVLTAVAESGLRIQRVREEPRADHPTIPGWLIVVAEA